MYHKIKNTEYSLYFIHEKLDVFLKISNKGRTMPLEQVTFAYEDSTKRCVINTNLLNANMIEILSSIGINNGDIYNCRIPQLWDVITSLKLEDLKVN